EHAWQLRVFLLRSRRLQRRAHEYFYMTKKFIGLISFVSAMCAMTLFGQQGTPKAGEGTLMLDKKNYPLKHAVAYETTISDEPAIAVVLSGQTVSSEALKEARETEKGGNDPNFKRPFLRLVFLKKEAVKYVSAAAGGTMLGRRSGSATGELKLQDGRVTGKASQPNETDQMVSRGSDTRSSVAVLKSGD